MRASAGAVPGNSDWLKNEGIREERAGDGDENGEAMKRGGLACGDGIRWAMLEVIPAAKKTPP